MGFTKTSEGRVFFKNADNDDTPVAKKNNAPAKDPVMPKDSTQMQMLLLLKSLNSKLKSSKSDQGAIKKQLAEYKATIKEIEDKTKAVEDKTSAQETNYIDLEQKVSQKQNEASKKATRVENSVKNTLKQIEEAKKLVEELESKDQERGKTLEDLKKEVFVQKKKDDTIIKNQKTLAATQKQQGEKMVDNVAAYVALTKRVSDAETKNEEVDNKLEDASSQYLKLDRKIDKAIEDRNRILRKVDRIEQAVLETRDALNAKAMVLLTDQGAVAGVNIPQISNDLSQTDPMVLNRRLQEEALMPWWRKPVRIQGTSFVLIMIIVLMLGWIMNGAFSKAPVIKANSNIATPTISLSTTKSETSNFAEDSYSNSYVSGNNNDLYEAASEENLEQTSNVAPSENNYGITIHEGYKEKDINVLDINNEEEMLRAFESDPDNVARQLNQIEPSSLTTQDKVEPKITKYVKEIVTKKPIQIQNNSKYLASLKNRIKPDPKLSEIAKKIEVQAFQGIPEAQHDMGAIYVAGHGQIKKDLGRAVLWFKEAAQNDISNAKYNLGVLYHQGLGVKQNIAKAMSLYNEAAKQGHPEAQYNLGIANIEGIGVPYNPARAASFFEQSANQGIIEGAYNLGLIHENGLLGRINTNEAFYWYKKAADNGSEEAGSALTQLASSLGIGINDVDEIAVNFIKTHPQHNKISSSRNLSNNITAQVQKELLNRGLYFGKIDGMSGPQTENAIKQFQNSVGLEVNGVPSQSLLNYLSNISDYR